MVQLTILDIAHIRVVLLQFLANSLLGHASDEGSRDGFFYGFEDITHLDVLGGSELSAGLPLGPKARFGAMFTDCASNSLLVFLFFSFKQIINLV